MDFLFHVSAASVLPFWALAIFLPHHAFTKRVMASVWIVMPPVLCYLALNLPHQLEMAPLLSQPTLTSASELFGSRWGANMVWAQIGAWDLLAGRWMYLDSRKREISAWIVSPILFLTIVYGPLGFALYGLVRVVVHLRGGEPTPAADAPL